MIRSVTSSDIPAITAIYNHYISHSAVTFEEDIIDDSKMKTRIEHVTQRLPWLVYVEDDLVTAYAYATPWKARSAYRYSVETSIYVDHRSQKRGIGSALYSRLMDELANRNFHTIIGGITLPNIGSIRLHEKLGFKKIAEFEEVGFKFGEWRNVGYWQLTLSEK
jgi:phosphinothricin acetyltransferase